MSLLKNLALAVLAVASFSNAAPIDANGTAVVYDVLVVGGGPAGLSALSGLARVRRNVLMLDSGVYRNALTRHVHDVIGSDGVAPAEFRHNARQGISKYDTATMKNATVVSIVSTGNANRTSFLATDSDGVTYAARKIILGTGMKDILPSTPGVKEAWSRGMFWCLWCDGYEHRDKPFGILGSLTAAIGSVLDSATLNKDVIAFVNGTDVQASWDTLDKTRPGWRQMLAGYGVQIENATINSIERLQDGAQVFNTSTGGASGTQYDLFQVNLADGRSITRGAFLTNFPSVQATPLGADMGVNVTSNKIVVNVANMRTNLAGVYAVGDANSDGTSNVPHAMYTGKKAAVRTHVDLANELAASFVTRRSLQERDVLEAMGTEVEALWEEARAL